MKLDTSDYKKGVTEAKQEGEKFAEHTENKVSPKVKAGWMAIVAVILKAVQAIKKLATESMDYADNISDLAAQYGVATDAISEMQYIADQSSTSIEGLTSSMTMLYNRAKQDGAAFQQLGISVKDTEGNFKTMDELFWETIGALNDMEDEGERSAYMLDLFGRSAMSIGEVARKSSDEIARMRQEAHDLGIVISKDTIQFASDFNDTVAVLKLQGRSVIASMVAGADDAEQRFDNFFEHLLEVAEEYLPHFIRFIIRFAHSIGTQLLSYAPTLIAEVIDVVIEAIFDTNWFEVGVDIAKAVLQGIINVLGSLFSKIFGVDVEKVDFGVGGYYGKKDTDISSAFDTGEEYEISENIRQDITVRVEASGDSTVSKETAEKTAEALAPYIDKILGGK